MVPDQIDVALDFRNSRPVGLDFAKSVSFLNRIVVRSIKYLTGQIILEKQTVL